MQQFLSNGSRMIVLPSSAEQMEFAGNECLYPFCANWIRFDAITLPQPEPRAIGEHLVVPSIRGRDVACAEWSNVRRFEPFL